MKKLLLAAAILGISGTAFAADNGIYAGGQVGWANTGNTLDAPSQNPDPSLYTSWSASNKNNVFIGGVFAGYQFSPYLAAQLGYDKLSNAKYSATDTYSNVPFGGTGNITEKTTLTQKLQIVDLVGKVMLPIQCSGFNVYAKAGAAYVYNDLDLDYSSTGDVNSPAFAVTGSGNTHAFRPEVGAGASYDITPNLVANVDYTFIPKQESEAIGNINAVTVGLAYHFA